VEDGIAMFPDAPTLRGTKHVLEMIKAVENGYSGTILFVIQMMGYKVFKLNRKMEPEFTKAVLKASKQGVSILAYELLLRKMK
jgi:sugar fermentation stimulation protein A